MLDYLDELNVPKPNRILAALGQKMLTLAAARSAGARPFLTTPEHTKTTWTILGNGPILAVEQRFVLEPDTAKAHEIARQDLDFYLPKAGYQRTLRHLGFTEEDLAHGGSNRLIDALVPHGDVATVLAGIKAHLDAGADHVAVQPLTPNTHHKSARSLPSDQFRRLATMPLT